MPDVLFRGAVPGVSAWLMPVAHGLLQAMEDSEGALAGFSGDLWRPVTGAASGGWHLLHLTGATDRLLSYALDQEISGSQRQWLQLERDGGAGLGAGELIDELRRVVDRGLEILRSTPDDVLHEPRLVGGARLPSTVFGLLVHASEHAQRHAGQLITTIKIISTAEV